MFNVTSGTVIPLGGPLLVDATASLSSTVTVVSAGSVRVSGSATLSASGTLDATSDTVITFAYVSPMSADTSMTAGISVYMQAGSANLSIDSSMVAASGILVGGSAALLADFTIEAAGGAIVNATVQSMEAEATLQATAGRGFFVTVDLMSARVDLSVSVSPVYRLDLPTGEAVFTDHHFFKRFPVDTGVSLLIEGGVGRLVEYPSDVELKAADIYFLGGYRHQVTPAERALIVSAGFGDLIQEV